MRRKSYSRHPQTRAIRSCQFETCEPRRLLAGLEWANRGDVSDQFQAAFGTNAEVARGVVDSALAEWNRVVTGYQGAEIDVQLTIAMNPANPSLSAFASNTVRDANGVPTSGNVTINMALDNMGVTQWYLDPTPDDHSEFMGPLQHQFARNPTSGGPAAGMRDLRTLLVHEIGHTMGIASGTALIYSNPAITASITNVADPIGPGNSYWLFQGPSVNAVMTDFDINALVTTTAGHNAMPRPGNTPINVGGQNYYTAIDTMQPTSLSTRRILLTGKTALMMSDMGYDVVPPQLFGTFHSVLNTATGKLSIQGGNDNTQINTVNQGPSADSINIGRINNFLAISIDIGVDVPGTGPGMTLQDQQGAFFSLFPIGDVKSIEIQGLGGDDTITVSSDLNFLDLPLIILGGDGDDEINGAQLLGNTQLIILGEDGDDTINGGPNVDSISGGEGDDKIFGRGGSDFLYGDDGNDEIRGETGNDTLGGGDGNDKLWGGLQNDTIEAEAGDDFLYGEAGLDTLVGGFGKDFLSGGDGNDKLIGGLKTTQVQNDLDVSTDTLQGGDGDDGLLGDNGSFQPLAIGASGGADFLYGGTGNDLIFGQGGNDQIQGQAGNDNIFGLSGNDVITGGTITNQVPPPVVIDGTDHLDGGDGNDTIRGDNFHFGFPGAFSFGGAADVIRGQNGTDVIYGQTGNDDIQGGADPDVIYGGIGNDIAEGNAGVDLIFGEDGNDRLVGGSGDDNLIGGAGSDTLVGGFFSASPNNFPEFGNDTLDGGADNDFLFGDSAALPLALGTNAGGNDTLRGGAGLDILYGQVGNDVLEGQSENDILVGGDGNDILRGHAGEDLLSGQAGGDQLDGGPNDDRLLGGDDNDHLTGGDGNDEINGNNGNDLIRGGNGNDELFGDAGDDILLGTDGVDVLFGGLGLDFLVGGSGPDQLDGGAASDLLVAGSTTFDNDDIALQAILAEWTSGRPYLTRIANIGGVSNPQFNNRLNQNFFLTRRFTIIDNDIRDQLTGGTSGDWFFADTANDLLTDLMPDEVVS